jgi:hypothetical protein
MLTRVLLLLMLLCPLTSVLSAEEVSVLNLSANGARNTRPFSVKDHWEIRWNNADTMLMVTVLRAHANGALESLPVATGSQFKPGVGSTYIEKGGDYYLNINASGDWTITVVQLP